MSMFREMLWSLVLDKIFPISDSAVKTALLDDETFNPKGYEDDVRYSMVKAATPTLSTMFTDNTSILNFDEFSLFPTTKIQHQQFKGCTSLTSIVLPTGTTEIESDAFAHTSALGSITFPNTLTTLGSQCFMYSGINISEVPNTITSMEMTVFYNCSNIKTMNFNYAGTEVPHGTFENSSQLESVNIADNVTVIGPYAFSNCIALTTANISPNTTKIDQKAFKKCAQLSSITLPNTLTEIGEEAFRECTSINFTIPDTVTTIGNHAFDASSLAPSKLPDSLTSLGFAAFGSCPTSITEIPSGLTEIKNNCLNSNTSYTITFPQSTKLTAIQGDREYFKPFKEDTVILVNTQDLVDEYEADTTWKKGIDEQGYVFSIPGNIVFEDSNMKTACVDRTTTPIIDINNDGEIAYWEASKCTTFSTKFCNNTSIKKFNELKYFKNISFPYGGSAPFSGCSKLEEVSFPDTLTTINDTNMFNGTILSKIDYNNLSNMYATLPSTVKNVYIHKALGVGERHGNNLTNLEGIYAYNGIDTFLGLTVTDSYSYESAIQGHADVHLYVDDTEVTEVTIPSTMTKIQKSLFARLPYVTSFTIPSSVTSLEDAAFMLVDGGATSSRTFTFANASKITSIAQRCFECNTAALPAGLFTNVTTIGWKAFYKNTNLPDVVANKLTTLSESAFYNSNIETFEATLLETVDKNCFYQCDSLTDVNVPNVKTIKQKAFWDCGALENINIGTSTTTINDYVFQNCSSLETINGGTELPDSITTIERHSFDSCTSLTVNKLPNSLIVADYGVFKGATNVNVSVLPASVTTLNNSFLRGTSSDHLEIKNTSKVTANIGTSPSVTTYLPMPDNSIFCVATEALINEYETDTTWADGIANHGYKFILDGNIPFESTATKAVVSAAFGTEGETSYYLAYKVTAEQACNAFKGNTLIDKFDEFKYFKGFTSTDNLSIFEGCTSLSSIKLPDTLRIINEDNGLTFKDTIITELDFNLLDRFGAKTPNTCTSIKLRKPVIFLGWAHLAKVAHIYVYDTLDNYFDSTIDCYDRNQFETDTHLYLDDVEVTEITIPSGKTEVRDSLLLNMINISKVTIPSSVTKLGKYSLAQHKGTTATRATNIVFEDASKITYIDDCALVNNLFTPPSDLFTNLTYIGRGAFWNNTNLPTEITIPNCTSVKQGSFSGSNIEKITGVNVETVGGDFSDYGYGPFNKCTSLRELTLSKVTKTTLYFCNEDTQLTKVTLGALTEIDSYSFYKCSSLATINSSTELPSTITKVAAHAFEECSSLTCTTLPSGITEMGRHAFAVCTGVTFTSLPTGITTLEYGLFYQSTNVNISEIPAGVTTINNRCLRETATTSVWIKSSTMATPGIGSWGGDFLPFNDNTVIYVNTAALKAEYEANEYWLQGINNHGYTFVVKS